MKQKTLCLTLAATFAATGAAFADNQQPNLRHQQSTQDELAAMKLSQACADSAEKAWRLAGYKSLAKGTIIAHSSHYNRELQRCLILITTTDLSQSGQSTMEEVFDAIEQLELGTLYSKGDIKFLTRFDEGVNKGVPATRENIAAFRNLMLK